MTGRTAVQSISGATLAISASLPTTYDAAGYSDTDIIWTLIGQVENYGNHGGSATVITFTPVDTAITAKAKGSKDYGSMALMIGSIPSDAGQVILATAFESTAHYSVRMTYPDGEIHYLDALISKHEFQDGAVNDVSKVAVDLAIARKPIVVVAP